MAFRGMNVRNRKFSTEFGQSITEMALVLPVLLLLVFGVFELGRILFIYSAINNASRETARFGAATGLTESGLPSYLDCAALRQTARDTAFLAGLNDGDIQIAYDKPVSGTMSVYANCGDAGLDPADVKQGDRIQVTITKTVEPILPLVGIPELTVSFSTARTILKSITVGPLECSDTLDNDGDGQVDWDGGGVGTPDAGCSGPDDTTEAFCYRLTVVNSPPEGGSLSIIPDPNCANRYIEQTLITLNAFPAEDYKFIRWSGSVVSTTNPVQFFMDADKDVIAEFQRLTSDLVVSKTASPDPVYSENTLSYLVNITNQGPDLARNVILTDTLPAGVSLQSWSISSGTCPTATSAEFRCSLPQLAVGSSVSLTIDVLAPVANNVTQTITNTVVASAREVDPNLLNNTATAAVELLPRAELTISKTDSADPVTAGETYDYAITVNNAGPDEATGVSISDILPSAIEPVIGSLPGGCSYNSSTREVACPVGSLTVGASTTLTFTVEARGNGRTVTNSVTVSGNEFENNPGNNTASETTLIGWACDRPAVTGMVAGSATAPVGPWTMRLGWKAPVT